MITITTTEAPDAKGTSEDGTKGSDSSVQVTAEAIVVQPDMPSFIRVDDNNIRQMERPTTQDGTYDISSIGFYTRSKARGPINIEQISASNIVMPSSQTRGRGATKGRRGRGKSVPALPSQQPTPLENQEVRGRGKSARRGRSKPTPVEDEISVVAELPARKMDPIEPEMIPKPKEKSTLKDYMTPPRESNSVILVESSEASSQKTVMVNIEKEPTKETGARPKVRQPKATKSESQREEMPKRQRSPSTSELASRINTERDADKEKMLQSPRGAKLLQRIKTDHSFTERLLKNHKMGRNKHLDNLTEEDITTLAVKEYEAITDNAVSFRDTHAAKVKYAFDNIHYAWEVMLAEKNIDKINIEVQGELLPITREEHADLQESLEMAHAEGMLAMAFEATPYAFDVDVVLALCKSQPEENKQFMSRVWSEWDCKTLADVEQRINDTNYKIRQIVGPWQGSPILTVSECMPKVPQPTTTKGQQHMGDEFAKKPEQEQVKF